MKKIVALISSVLFIVNVFAQDYSSSYDEMNELRKIILSRKSDSIRLIADKTFTKRFEDIVYGKRYNKEKLQTIDNLSIVYSSDSSLSIITWIFPYNNGDFHFHGYIIREKKHAQKIVYKLNDNYKNITNPEKNILDKENWYGALYYKLIENNKNEFTLLGWNGYDAQTNQKIIDVLSFSDNDLPVFGKYIFTNYPQNQSRILFRYSASTTFSLKYDEIKILVEKNRMIPFSRRTRIVNKSYPLIVFNKLESINRTHINEYKYYIPLSETINAFRYKNGSWVFMEDITIVGDVSRNRKKKKINMNLFPNKGTK